jgi:hypothetical protein
VKKKAKLKADPIFGVAALNDLGQKASARIKPFQKLREHRKLRIRNTQLYRDHMRYVLGERDE